MHEVARVRRHHGALFALLKPQPARGKPFIRAVEIRFEQGGRSGAAEIQLFERDARLFVLAQKTGYGFPARFQKGGKRRKPLALAFAARVFQAEHRPYRGQALRTVVGEESGHRGHEKELFRRAVNFSRLALLAAAA